MSSGPQRPFVSVKFSPVGRTFSFLLPELALDANGDYADARPRSRNRSLPGDAVVVNTAEGHGARHRHPHASGARRRARPAPPDSDLQVVRRATRDDVVTRLKQQQREQEAHRICLMKIRERGLAMKLARVEQLFDGSRLIFYYTAEGARRFPRAGARSRGALPHPHRDAADRRPRRGQDARRLRLVRPAALLHDVPADVRAGLDQDGEAAGPEPQPVEAVGACAAA